MDAPLSSLSPLDALFVVPIAALGVLSRRYPPRSEACLAPSSTSCQLRRSHGQRAKSLAGPPGAKTAPPAWAAGLRRGQRGPLLLLAAPPPCAARCRGLRARR